MSQLARRENAPHRAAFVTSLSRWYIRRLLGSLPLFHPCLSAERRPRIAPCATDILPGNQGTASHFRPATSLPGTGCTRWWPCARLPGDLPARPRFTHEYTLRHRDAFQRGAWPASGRWNTRNFGVSIWNKRKFPCRA